MENKKNVFLIVLYNKEIHQSSTLKSLMQLSVKSSLFYIVNNGPKKLSLDNKSSLILTNGLVENDNEIVIKEFLANKPLSKIYNDLFVEYPGGNNYVILDDDTCINESYLSLLNCCEVNADLIMPVIKSVSGSEVYYPMVNGYVYSIPGIIRKDSRDIFSIGSGLIIKKSLVEKFNLVKMKPFDERFALYGVDFSLFRRIVILNVKYRIFPDLLVSGYINHSLSRKEKSDESFRSKERMIDLFLSNILYCKTGFRKFLFIIKFFLRLGVRFDFDSIFLVFKLLIEKKHPRC